MPNLHLSRFNQFTLEKKSFKEALQQTHALYLAELLKASKKLRSRKAKTADEKLRRALRGFRKHIENSEIGHLVIGYEFKIPLPPEFEAFLKLMQLREQNILNTPSALVRECEIKIAQEEHSPQVIYAQLAKLERALVKEEVPFYHREEVQCTIIELATKLYEKLAYVILHSKDAEELERKVQEAFTLSLIDEIPDSSLAFFKHESDSQIEFLLENKFLTYFYELRTLAQKYNYTFNYYQTLKAQDKLTTELRATLSQLFYLIINTAYAPCEAKKFNLMRQNGATLEEVFATLKEWTKENWREHQENDFIAHLESKLSDEHAEYLAWVEVHIREGDFQAPLKPMYQLFARKNYQGETSTPHELLKAMPSPQKPKPKATFTTNVATTPISLFTTETLPPDEEIEIGSRLIF